MEEEHLVSGIVGSENRQGGIQPQHLWWWQSSEVTGQNVRDAQEKQVPAP